MKDDDDDDDDDNDDEDDDDDDDDDDDVSMVTEEKLGIFDCQKFGGNWSQSSYQPFSFRPIRTFFLSFLKVFFIDFVCPIAIFFLLITLSSFK